MTCMSTAALSQRLADHMVSDERDFASMQEMHRDIRDTISEIKTNHLAHIEPDVAGLRTDVDWLKKIMVGTLLSAISGLIATLFQILI